MAARSSASTVWEGDLAHGAGTTTPESGAFPPVEVSWASRTERAAGKTSPEELLAAAHASCFCMALSNELGGAGTLRPCPLGAEEKSPTRPGPRPCRLRDALARLVSLVVDLGRHRPLRGPLRMTP